MFPASKTKTQVLKERAFFLQEARSFLSKRGFLEVDTPILGKAAPIDEHIDIMTVDTGDGIGYLHSSPEYAMKRLLAEGVGDIYQLSHVFRQGEIGPLHNPEFTMVEWYRVGASYTSFIEETLAFIRLFLGPLPHQFLSYRNAFLQFAGIDPFLASAEELHLCAHTNGIHLVTKDPVSKDTLLQLLITHIIEPHFGKDNLLVLIEFPSSQAALAATEWKDGQLIANRFEIYHQGIELANGYQELTDVDEQRKRLLSAKEKRVKALKQDLPIDECFLLALQKGLPPCCGVAVGFDRLFLLQQKAQSLAEVLPLV